MKDNDIIIAENLLSKFFAGEISDNELTQLYTWLESDSENRRIFDHENELWQAAGVTISDNYRTEKVWMNIASGLELGKNKYKSVTIIRKNSLRILISAAVLACLVAIGWLILWMDGRSSLSRMLTETTLVKTHEGEKASIILPDSTKIILNSESSIEYDGSFNNKNRLVKLKGEAYFDVSTNPEKPFVVNLGQISISATGTRFNVFSFDNEDRVETTLEEGAIKVSIKGMEPINVKSGQQVVYFVSSGKVLVRDVAIDTYTAWKENKLRFYDTSFEEVLRGIGRKYNVTFDIKDSTLLSLKYTATFIDESIEEVMDMLKDVSPITFEIHNRTSIGDKLYVKPEIIIRKRRIN